MFSAQHYEHFRANNTVFADLVGAASVSVPVQSGGSAAETLRVNLVSDNFFTALGVQPAFGRALEPSDSQAGTTPAAVVSWRYWKSHFNLDPNILGTPMTIADIPATIVGVAREDFSGLVVGYETDVWIPATVLPGKLAFVLIARLKADATIDQARAEMRVLDRPRIEDLGRRDPQWLKVTFEVHPARAGLRTPLHDQFGGPLMILMGAVGALLLLACTNIASLLLARGAARAHEMAVRVALGARPVRIVRQVFTESLLLSAAGSALGLVLAYFGAGALARIMISGTRAIGAAPKLEVNLDGTVLIFTIAIAGLAAVLFGVLPGWTAFVSAPVTSLRSTARISSAHSRGLLGQGLVVAQVGLSVVLVSAAALFVRHLTNLRDRDLGFDRTSVLLVSLDPSRSGIQREQLMRSYEELLTRFEAIPGVRSVTLSGMTPISGAAGSRFVTVDGFQEDPQSRRRVSMNVVAPKYFETLGTPLLAGRDFTMSDDRSRPRVIIVNQSMARFYFGDNNPLGRHVRLEGDAQPYEVVGVVADAKYSTLREPAPRTMYVPAFQQGGTPSQFALKLTAASTSVSNDVRRIVENVVKSVPVTKITTLSDQLDASIVPERLTATLSSFLGVLAALLSAIGLYGLLAYTVARRTREIGVRVALGATRKHVVGMVVAGALKLVAAGLLVGIPCAIASERIAGSRLPDLGGQNGFALAFAAAAMMLVATLAAYLPARQASRVDPIVALRAE
jgi:predicted permease